MSSPLSIKLFPAAAAEMTGAYETAPELNAAPVITDAPGVSGM